MWIKHYLPRKMLLQKGKLKKEELGLIEVLDHSSYAAVSSEKIEAVVNSVKNEKIKNRKIKIEIIVNLDKKKKSL